MGAALITGCSGSGKSTVAAELSERGYTAIDADNVIARWLDRSGSPVWMPDDASATWFDQHTWSWDLTWLDDLIASADTMYVCGAADNIARAWTRFERVYLLAISEATMLSRVDDQDRLHDFGRRPGQREWIRRWRPRYQDEVLALGAIEVDADRDLAAVVDTIVGG
ncbi:dephospho-CoA kinase [Actinokineospora inagensis]|uniref:dephospho-CoA kinase n=1 Tax=Actinokineospora inagensis TaxID=103730 RepID=UPI000408204D|nr:dephospho-CoA kinase [Actinokineospora inagensis]